MLIKIVSIDAELKTAKNGKTYKALTVVYKNREGKIETKTINPFGPGQNTVSILSEATTGQYYEVQTVKNDAGYWDWVDPRVTDGQAASSPAAAPSPASRASSGGENRFETSEERAKKQVYIVRQSSLSNAVETLAVGSKTTLDPKKVIEVARLYEAYVFDTAIEEPAQATKASEFTDDDIDF